MSWLRFIAAACVFAALAFGAGMIKGASDVRAAVKLAQAEADTRGAQANGAVNAAAANAASDFGDLQLRTRTEAADARRDIEHAAPPTEGRVGAQAMVDASLGVAVVCRIERLRGEPASIPCRPAP